MRRRLCPEPWRWRVPDLDFQITAVEAAVRSVTPLLHFKVQIVNTPPEELIQAVLLTPQIQIQ